MLSNVCYFGFKFRYIVIVGKHLCKLLIKIRELFENTLLFFFRFLFVLFLCELVIFNNFRHKIKSLIFRKELLWERCFLCNIFCVWISFLAWFCFWHRLLLIPSLKARTQDIGKCGYEDLKVSLMNEVSYAVFYSNFIALHKVFSQFSWQLR